MALQSAPTLCRRRRLIVVEDDRPLLSALTFALEAEGFQIDPFLTGAAVLDARPSADCLIVDFRLPDMDGLTLIARLRAAGGATPAILITSDPDARSRRRAAQAGVEIVEKPLMTEELRGRIESLIGQTPSSRA